MKLGQSQFQSIEAEAAIGAALTALQKKKIKIRAVLVNPHKKRMKDKDSEEAY